MRKEIKEKAKMAYELAYKYEKEFGACSQCTIRALQEVYNEEDKGVFQALGGFAGGGACECDGICGAYAAGIYFFGTKTGRGLKDIGSNIENPSGSRKHREQFKLIKKLHDRFIDKYGSIICSSIHRKLYGRSFYIADWKEMKKFDEAGAHDWGCTSVCGETAKWIVEIFEEFKQKK